MVCDVQSWLVWKLTGSFRTSWASADPLGMFDLKNKCWSAPILNTLELNEAQLPQAFGPGTLLGSVNEEASHLTGLSRRTSIIAGSGDGQAAGLGANALTPERAYLNLGTAIVAGIYGSSYITNKAFRTMYACSENGYYYECSLRAGSFAIDWFIRNILHINPLKQPEIYKQLETEARSVPAGSNGVLYLPYLSGVMNPYWDTTARGAFIGLSSSHNRGNMYRALLEGIAFEQLLALSAVEEVIGIKIKELVVIGGGSVNRLWCRIMADITGKNICLPVNSESSALGAGITAAIGAGWYSTFKEAAVEMTAVKEVIRPQEKNHQPYQQLFNVYKNIYPALKKVHVLQ